MSHFVIDEDFDRMIIDAIARRDGEALCAIYESCFQSGTSELKNWIAAAGALFGSELSGGLVDSVDKLNDLSRQRGRNLRVKLFVRFGSHCVNGFAVDSMGIQRLVGVVTDGGDVAL